MAKKKFLPVLVQIGKTKVKITTPEDYEHLSVIKWRDMMHTRFPGLRLLHHIPNGGKRNVIVALKLKLMGVLPGVSDLFLPHARGGYFGLYIEMKPPKAYSSKVSDSQQQWIDSVIKEGYRAVVCYGANEAMQAIIDYYKLEPTIAFKPG